MKKASKVLSMMVIVLVLLSMVTSVSLAVDEGHFQASVDGSSGDITITVPDSGQAQGSTGYDVVISGYKTLIQGFVGLCAITAVIFLIISISKFGASGSNDRERQMAIKGILISGIALSLFGGMGVFVSIFWTALVS